MNNELKFIYKKKQGIKNKLHKTHLLINDYWDKHWEITENNITDKLKKMHVTKTILNKTK
jgi:hypothetical protein